MATGYSTWTAAEKQSMLDDIQRMICQGKKIDGTSPPSVASSSVQAVVNEVHLMRVGDDPDPITGDTHPKNLEHVSDQVDLIQQNVQVLVNRP